MENWLNDAQPVKLYWNNKVTKGSSGDRHTAREDSQLMTQFTAENQVEKDMVWKQFNQLTNFWVLIWGHQKNLPLWTRVTWESCPLVYAGQVWTTAYLCLKYFKTWFSVIDFLVCIHFYGILFQKCIRGFHRPINLQHTTQFQKLFKCANYIS